MVHFVGLEMYKIKLHFVCINMYKNSENSNCKHGQHAVKFTKQALNVTVLTYKTYNFW